MKDRAFRVFAGICLLATLYGGVIVLESQTNLASGFIDRQIKKAVLKVDTPQSRQVLAVVTRILTSADQLVKNPLNMEILNNMVRAAMEDKKIDTTSFVDVQQLIEKIQAGNGSYSAADVENTPFDVQQFIEKIQAGNGVHFATDAQNY